MKIFKRKFAFLLCIILSIMYLAPLTIYAVKPERKVVRVGWYESPFNTTDKFGRRSGYAYEYQRKIASYTGWEYEYINSSWSNLMQMLIDGEIDLMSDVSYTEERAEKMLFPDFPMGAEEYYLFISKNNTEIKQDDYSTLNGKKVGVNKGSIQIQFLNEWTHMHGIQVEIAELTNSVDDALKMLDNGEIDAYLTLDSYGDPEKNVPICEIGSSDFFFVVSNKRQDILNELNMALSKIHEENRFYNAEMYEKYNRTSSSTLNLTEDESKWLESKNNTIRVGYQDNYLAFCATDKNGKLTGALKDYLDFATNCFNTQTVSYPTASKRLIGIPSISLGRT